MVGSAWETLSGRLLFLRDNTIVDQLIDWLLDWLIDWLIKWMQSTPAFDHRLVLNRSCLRAWIQLNYYFFYHFSLPLHFATSKFFCFAQCPKRQGGVKNFSDSRIDLWRKIFNVLVLLTLGQQRYWSLTDDLCQVLPCNCPRSFRPYRHRTRRECRQSASRQRAGTSSPGTGCCAPQIAETLADR